MNTNVKAVVNLMQTLGVTLEDVKKEFTADSSTEKFDVAAIQDAIVSGKLKIREIFSQKRGLRDMLVEYIASSDFSASLDAPKTKGTCEIERNKTRNGMTYISYNGVTIGLVFDNFVLALRNQAQNIKLKEAQQIAASLFTPTGKKWIVPSDTHWKTVSQTGLNKVNDALKELGGDIIDRTGFLSSTSQANRPWRWNVRFILPL